MAEASYDESTVPRAPSAARRIPISVVPGLVLVADISVILLAAGACYRPFVFYSAETTEQYIFAVGFVLFATVALYRRAGLYRLEAIMRPIGRSDTMLAGVATAFLFFLTIAFSLKVSEVYSRLWIYSFGASTAVGICTVRCLIWLALKRMDRAQVIGRSMVILGTGEQARRFAERLGQIRPHFTSVAGVYADAGAPEAHGPGATLAGLPVLGDTEALIAEARAHRVDDVVVALPWQEDGRLAATVERLKELPINVYLATDLAGFRLGFRPVMGDLADLPVFEVEQRPISGWASVLKRVEDYLLAGIALLLLSPLLILVAIAIKIDSPGPVFFMQKRLGFNNEVFEIFKFRSMYHREVPEHRVQQASKDDPRITRVGRIIRRTSIDELPQLLNVLNGTMSLVGPRPHALSHNEEYGARIRGYFARHKVKPGITGWAQVNGLRGETETDDKMEARVRHDVYYADNWSLLFDLRILVMTVLVVLFQRSAY